MIRTQEEDKLATALAGLTGTRAEDWFLVFKARYGMQVVFEAAAQELGRGSVATQLFTCCTAVTPVLAAGLRPVYADISRASAGIDPDALALDGDAAALMVQHTYGVVDEGESARLVAQAHAAGALAVEDSAHCVGRMARDAHGAPLADVSVHSFGVEKILNTKFGGAVWINPETPFPAVAARARAALAALPQPGRHLDLLTRAYRVENRALAMLPVGASRALRSGLYRAGLFEVAVSDGERRGELPYRPMRPNDWSCARAREALAGLERDEARRRAAVGAYRAAFAQAPDAAPLAASLDGPLQPLLRFPVLLHDAGQADRVIDAVNSAGFFAQSWYRPLLGPGVLDAGRYGVPDDLSGLPVTAAMSEAVAALPTNVDADSARAIAGIVLGVVSS